MDLSLRFDPENNKNNVVIDSLSIFIQEIEMCLRIAPSEIWGLKFAIDTQKYMFNQYITLNQIQGEITNYITEKCSEAPNFNHRVDVDLYEGEAGKVFIYVIINIWEQVPEAQPYILNYVIGQFA